MEEYLKEQGKKFNIENYFKPESYTIPNALAFAIDKEADKKDKGKELGENSKKAPSNQVGLKSVSLLGKSSEYNILNNDLSEMSLNVDHDKLLNNTGEALSIKGKLKINDRFAVKVGRSLNESKLGVSQNLIKSNDGNFKLSQDLGFSTKKPLSDVLTSDGKKEEEEVKFYNKFKAKLGDFNIESGVKSDILSKDENGEIDFDISYDPEDPNIAQKALLESIRATSILKNFALMDSSSNEKSNKNEEGINNDIALY